MKDLRRISVYALTIASAVVCAYAFVSASSVPPPDDSSAPAAASSSGKGGPAAAVSARIARIAKDPAAPARLLIPGIGVDAAVRAVGVTASGTLSTPGNFTDVGWYAAGTLPGKKGSAVIDGHVNNGLGMDAVFARIALLKPGDSVYVSTNGGKKIHFIVSRVDRFPYSDAPLADIFDQRDGSYLKLVTCDGVWIPSLKTYDHRLIATAELAAR